MKGNAPYLRRFVIVYFGVLLITGAASCWLVYAHGGEPWAAATIALGMLTVFGLLGIGLTLAFGRGLIAALKKAEVYIRSILDEKYGLADGSSIESALPGLGDLVTELAGQFKERLGFSRSILEGLPISTCIVDTSEKITFLNRECLEMLGSDEDPESYYGRMISQIFYKDDRKSLIGTCMDEDTRVHNREAVFKHADGSDINALLNLFPLHDVDGRVIGGCCLYINTTELKRREAEIVSQNERIALAASEATSVSEELSAAATQLSALVSQAHGAAGIQTERTGETATAMEEMNVTVIEVARYALEAATDADEARARAEEGASIVTEMVSAINEVADHATGLKRSMEELDSRSDEIGKVLSVIEDIADQTNLLALNAAIEAARAGDAGRGFAVVADEVRKLAEKTMQATSEVHAAITGIQEGARENVRATDTAVNAVEKSTTMAARSGEALKSIVSVAENTADRVRSIATAAEQQSATSEEINRATMDVNRLCGETDLVMGDAAKAIDRLAVLADKLTATIGKMR